jgi:hypothetical protein
MGVEQVETTLRRKITQAQNVTDAITYRYNRANYIALAVKSTIKNARS